MRRFTTMIGALLLMPTVAMASGKTVSISELRQQVETMGRWTQTYEAYIYDLSGMGVRVRLFGVSKGRIEKI